MLLAGDHARIGGCRRQAAHQSRLSRNLLWNKGFVCRGVGINIGRTPARRKQTNCI
jgi:hypothetical protein